MRINSKKFIAQRIEEIKNEVGDQKTVVACSGGVDSTTCTILAHKALGEKLLAVFIDDGLMRENEPPATIEYI